MAPNTVQLQAATGKLIAPALCAVSGPYRVRAGCVQFDPNDAARHQYLGGKTCRPLRIAPTKHRRMRRLLPTHHSSTLSATAPVSRTAAVRLLVFAAGSSPLDLCFPC